MITKVLENLLINMELTFEPEKRAHIKRNADRVQHKLVFGPQAAADGLDYIMSKNDMAVLMTYSVKNCQICMGSPADCKQCQLGQTLDRVSFVSRQNRAWWEVFSRACRTDIGKDPGYLEGVE